MSNKTIQNALKIMGFADNEEISEEKLKKEYRKQSRKAHPDKGGTVEKFQELSNAYDVLKKEVEISGSFKFSERQSDPAQNRGYPKKASTASDNNATQQEKTSPKTSTSEKKSPETENIDPIKRAEGFVREKMQVQPKSLSRENAETLALNGRPVFRESTTQPGKIAITYRHENGETKHYLLEDFVRKNPESFLTKDKTLAYLSTMFPESPVAIDQIKPIVRPKAASIAATITQVFRQIMKAFRGKKVELKRHNTQERYSNLSFQGIQGFQKIMKELQPERKEDRQKKMELKPQNTQEQGLNLSSPENNAKFNNRR